MLSVREEQFDEHQVSEDVWGPMQEFLSPLPLPARVLRPGPSPAPAPAPKSSPPPGACAVDERQGDLLSSDCDVIIHCCNCFHTMGAGIARSIRGRFPEAYDADRQTPRGDARKLGHYSAALCGGPGGVTVVNLYGQFDWGRPTFRRLCYAALRIGLARLLEALGRQGVLHRAVIGTYWLGCSNAGGDKEVCTRRPPSS
eukprot:m51a1_g12831 hypothetical protein (199) ;mRNA; r:24-738